jgi:uncharacterized protein YcnI
MSRFVAEPDDEFDGQVVVVELSEDSRRNGTVVGCATGEDAMDIAQEAADQINTAGHQPDGLDGYTVAAGEEF